MRSAMTDRRIRILPGSLRLPMMAVALAVCGLALPALLSAAELDGSVPDTIRVPATPLESASISFARSLSEVSGDRLADSFAGEGIRLHLDGDGYAGLSARQAVASIREFLHGFDPGETVVTKVAPIDGSSDRGFAEAHWSARMSGTSQEIRRTLFLGLRREEGEWKIDEVRFLR